MTIWSPEIKDRSSPMYRAIADAIAADVERGDLKPGDRLPTHRDLAASMHVALTTVTRAYAEAERRGLVRGEVGRGTFVRGWGFRGEDGPAADGVLDLATNATLPYAHLPMLLSTMSRMIADGDPSRLLGYHPHSGSERQRAAGAAWMRRAGLETLPDRVLVTTGAQHAMATIFATITEPGDTLLVEELTYSGMKSLAHLLRLRLHPIEMDEQGIVPDALRRGCADGGRALYCIPTLQNPTAAIMSRERRQTVVAIARDAGVTIVEDDSYGFMAPDVQPLATLSDDVYYICGASKSIAPAFRVGWVRAPAAMVDRLDAAIGATVYFNSPLLADVVAAWVDDGTADAVVAWKRTELAARQAIARRVLAGYDYRTQPYAQHGWLPLPEPWTGRDFAAQARMRGVRISPADDYVAGRAPAPHAVRICVGAVPARAQVEQGLHTLAAILREPPEPRPVRA